MTPEDLPLRDQVALQLLPHMAKMHGIPRHSADANERATHWWMVVRDAYELAEMFVTRATRTTQQNPKK